MQRRKQTWIERFYAWRQKRSERPPKILTDRVLTRFTAIMIYVFVIAAVVLLFQSFLIQAYRVEGSSMEPTYKDGKLVWCAKFIKTPKANSVMALTLEDGSTVIKRVVALPGETIEFLEDRIYVNGEDIGSAGGNTEDMVWCLLEDEYFVLGDNRSDSMDSRSFGLVNKGQFIGCILN